MMFLHVLGTCYSFRFQHMAFLIFGKKVKIYPEPYSYIRISSVYNFPKNYDQSTRLKLYIPKNGSVDSSNQR
jgi:hypothetical protein